MIGLDFASVRRAGWAPLSECSAERAVKHIAVIARAPHPINSPEHDAVRDYILNTLRQIGVTPQVQRTTDVNETYGVEGAVENIVCRLRVRPARRQFSWSRTMTL